MSAETVYGDCILCEHKRHIPVKIIQDLNVGVCLDCAVLHLKGAVMQAVMKKYGDVQ
tara:strand:- start:568 stop:738 length:171 start_codon:yes stop_codon:yes gene_type:complete